MSVFGSIGSRYQKECATSDHHHDKELKTHYYKENFNALFQSVEEIYKNDKNVVRVHSSKEHGEIGVELRSKQIFIMITIVSLRPYETAVDLIVTTEETLITGIYPLLKAEVLRLYEQLDQKHTYVGTR